MKKSQGKLKLLGCIMATFVISAGLFVNLSSKQSHNCDVHAEGSIEWALDISTGYHSYINEVENRDWQARPVNAFYLERTSTLRVDCDIYDMLASADGVLLEDRNVSFDFGIGAYSYEIVSGDAGPVYRFQNLTCTECGTTMQTFDMPINQVGIVVSDYDEASWVYSSNINFHQKNVSSEQFSYTAVPVDLKYDETNQYLKVTCNVSIYDLQNNTEIIYTYQQPSPVFWYEEAICDPLYNGQQMTGYACTGRCADDQRLEEFDVDSSVSRSLVDLSDEFPSGSGQEEDFSVSIYLNDEIISEELFVSPESERIVLSAQVSPTQPDMVYNWESTDVSVAQVDPNDSQCLLHIVSTGYSTIIVTATYNNVTATARIRLVSQEQEPETQAEITSLELLENPPTYYYVGDVIDFTNIILVAHYSDGTTREVTSNDYDAYLDPEANPSEPLVSGDYMLYFSYEGVRTERGVPIYVNERPSETYEFEITFDPNNGIEDDVRSMMVQGSSLPLSYDIPQGFTPIYEGYTFLGWYYDGYLYQPGETIEGIRSNITLLGQWENSAEEIRYTIHYYPNGADGSSFEGYTDYISGDSSEVYYEFAALPEEYYREGYTFVGWSRYPDETESVEYLPNTSYLINRDLDVYAVWIDESSTTDEYSYEIIFVANNGTSDTQIDPFTSPEPSITYNLPSIEQVGFTREGYSFVGWSYYSDGEVLTEPPVIEAGRTSTFYAIWELVEPMYTYTVTFDGNGATSGSTDPIVLSGDDYSQTLVFPVCGYEREGYIFAGWGFNSEAIIKFQPGEERDITSDTTLYAIWTQVFTISFDANGGEGTMDNITIPKGNASMPECGFTREGYSFAGWAVGSPSGDVYQTGDTVYVSADYVLYATWEAITPITEIEISVAEPEIVLYVDDVYIVQYSVTPEDAAGELVWRVDNEEVAAVVEDGMIAGLSTGTTTVTISDRSGTTSVSFVVYVVERPVPVQPENPISEETIESINDSMEDLGLDQQQVEQINNVINENQDYISDEAGSIIAEALAGTTINTDDPIVAEAQKELIVTVVQTGVAVDAGKATSISGAQQIDKALPESANFSVEGEIDEFYQRQMVELFGGEMPTKSRRLTRAGASSYEIDTDTQGKSGQEGADYLAGEQALYENMVDFVDTSVDHMGKASLKLRKCSGESVTVQVKSYVTVVKVSSFREFDQEAADKEFVEAVYKAILLSMQNEVISILEKDHKPSSNAEKEAQYQKELEAVKDYETFEIMVTEVLRQKYVALTGEQIDDVDDFKPIYWEIFTAWALDQPSPYAITLEELTQTTIDQSTGRAKSFTVNSNLTGGEWAFIGGIAGGAALIIAGFAVVPNVLKKKRAKEGK